MGVLEGEEREHKIGNLSEKMIYFPNLVREIDIQVQETQSPKQDEFKRPTPRHIIIKMTNVKDRES